MAIELQTRFIPFSQSDLKIETKQDAQILRGYAAKFDTMSGELFRHTSGIRETIRKGFFKNALNQPGQIFALFNHDDNFVLGERNAGTLRIDEDAIGLPFEISLSDSRAVRDYVVTPIMRGELAGCSFRAMVDMELVEYDRKADVFHMMPGAATLMADVGPVTFPAYPDTEVAARSIEFFIQRKRVKNITRKDREQFQLMKSKYGRIE